MKLLLTGASGRVARAVRPLLPAGYELRLLQQPGEAALALDREREAAVVGDIMDLEQMRRAVRGVDAVVHLAASVSMDIGLQEALSVNVLGTGLLLQAMQLEGVRRIVYASSNHATGAWETSGVSCDGGTSLRGDSFYGASKAMGEILVRLYVDLHGFSGICLRIGSFRSRPENPRQLSTWISPRDMAQIMSRAVESAATWGVFYAISGNSRRYWDIDSAREELGYVPEDDAESFAHLFEPPQGGRPGGAAPG